MKTRRLAFIAILAGAAALRFVPLWFGLPYPHARPDEATAIGHAAGMLSGDLNPHFFNWPTLTLYLFAGVFTAAKATAGTLSNDAMTLLARGVVAVTGVATIAALAWLGRLIADEATGLVAALFLAVAVLHVRDSHFATTDVPTAFLATLALALVTRAAATKLTRDFGAAGVVSGLAVASKYTAATLIATAVAAPSLAAAGVFAAAMCVGFAAGAPFALLDPRAFLADFAFERSHLSAGQAVDLGRGWVYHLTTSLPYGLGVPIFAAAAAGFVVVLWVCGRRAAGPVAFALVYYAAIGSGLYGFLPVCHSADTRGLPDGRRGGAPGCAATGAAGRDDHRGVHGASRGRAGGTVGNRIRPAGHPSRAHRHARPRRQLARTAARRRQHGL